MSLIKQHEPFFDPSEIRLQVAAVGLPDPPSSVSSLHVALQSILPANYTMPSMASTSAFPVRLMALASEAMSTKRRSRRRKALQELFAGYGAVCEAPACFFADDICEMYPGIKFILNTRSKSAYARHRTVKDAFGLPVKLLASGINLLFSTEAYIPARNHFLTRRYHVSSLYAPELYERHNAWIRKVAYAKGVEILEWNEDLGWGPLCSFLGVEEPQIPFPHVNHKTFKAMLKVAIA